ncbi:MAG: hypothetical protein JWM90_2172 [Thermoleophilia bacterium]|nr:hypothetical protein [Thermoleophilia bacterium]
MASIGHINHPKLPHGGDMYAGTKLDIGAPKSLDEAIAATTKATLGTELPGAALLKSGDAFEAVQVGIATGMRCGAGPNLAFETIASMPGFQPPVASDPNVLAFIDGAVVLPPTPTS